MRVGDWVILEKFSKDTAFEGKEGEIKEVHLKDKTCRVELENGKGIFVYIKNMRVIRKHINYSELLNIALSPLDKPWCEQISQKMKELNKC